MVNSSFSLQNKRCVVVGASSGIGKHCAKVLLDNGAKVVGASRNLNRLTAAAKEFEEIGLDVANSYRSVEMDIRDKHSVLAGVEKAVEKIGVIDVLVNCVSSVRSQSFVDIDESTWQFIINTNLSGYFRVSKAIASTMIDSGTKGAIIHFSSILSHWVKPNQTSFSVAKAAVEQLTRNMAYELATSDIRVNAIVPGYFESAANLEFLESAQGEQFVKELVPRRLGKYHELDGVLILLASDASSYISGATITVDGASRLGSGLT